MNIIRRIINPLNFGDPITKSVGLTNQDRGFAQTRVDNPINRFVDPIVNTALGFATGGPVGGALAAGGSLAGGLASGQQQQGQPQFSFPSMGEEPSFTQPQPFITASPRPTGALSSFSVARPSQASPQASGSVPSEIGGNVAPSLGNQAFQNPIQKVGNLINPDLMERLRGMYSGRMTF